MKFYKSKLFVYIIEAAIFVAIILLVLLIPFCRHGGFEAQEAVYRAGEHGSLAVGGMNENKVPSVSFEKGKGRGYIYAVPDEGYEFVMWSDGKSNYMRCDGMSEKIDVTAHFKQKEYTVEYVPSRGGYIRSAGGYSQKVPHGGQTVIVEAVAEYGYEFVRWSDGGAEAFRTDMNVRENKRLTAEFAAKTVKRKFVLDDGAYFSHYAGEGGGKECELTLSFDGGGKSLYVKLEPGFEFDKWSDGNAVMNRTFYYNENAETLYGATKKILYKAGYSAYEGGYIDGNTFQEGYYEEQTSPVTAVPLEGYKFVRWSDGVREATRYDVLKKDVKVYAEFEKIAYYVRYLASNGGYISGQATQKVIYGESSVPVTAIPNRGYTFMEWSDGCTEATRSDASFETEITVLTAVFTNLFAGGNGTAQSPFQIATYAQLNNMREYPSAYFILIDDLNVIRIHEPIFDDTVPFEGSFDGQGYCISGLTVSSNSTYPSIFGKIGKNAKVIGLKIDNLTVQLVKGYAEDEDVFAGALAGICSGTVYNVNASVEIRGSGDKAVNVTAGGMVGMLTGNVRNCESTVNISLGEYAEICVGGFAGISSGNVKYCESAGEITLEKDGETTSANRAVAGGLIGQAEIESDYIYSSTSSVNITSARNVCAGGFIGISYAPVSNSRASGNVTVEHGKVGGFIGEAHLEINGCYAVGNVKGTLAAGFVNEFSGKMIKCSSIGNVNGAYASGFILDAIGSVERSYSQGEVTATIDGCGFIWTNNADVSNCYSKCNINFADNSGSKQSAAGLVLLNNKTIANCYYAGKISAAPENSELEAYGIGRTYGSVNNCHWLWYADGAAQEGCAENSGAEVIGVIKYETAEAMYNIADLLNAGNIKYWGNCEGDFPIVR